MSPKKNFDDLKKSFDEGRLIPFVGAGFSMIDAKMPGWSGLLKKIANVYSLQDDEALKDLDYLEQAEYLKRKRKEQNGQDSVEKQVCDALKDLPTEATLNNLEPHKLLLQNFDRIYTTNFDSYFEKLANSIKIKIQNVPQRPANNSNSVAEQHPYITINRSSNIATCLGRPKSCDFSQKACRLIKYHGDCETADSLVFTETSYFKRLLDADIKDILFAGDAVFYDFLFLGYGFGDISLKYTLQQLERVIETLAHTKSDERGERKTRFFILRTNNNSRTKYQNFAYNLRSVEMASYIPTDFVQGGCKLTSFYPVNGERSEVKKNDSIIFPSFKAVWNCAEANLDKPDETYCTYTSCEPCSPCVPDETACKKIHLANPLTPCRITRISKRFRAQILNQGFTEFLKKLVS